MHGETTLDLPVGSSLLEGPGLEVLIRLESKGPVATRERVTDADLMEARAEAWWASHPLRGFPNVPLEETRIVLVPVSLREEDEPGGSLAGFILEVVDPGETVTRLPFLRSTLDHVAVRAARRLVAEGRLERSETYYYELRATSEEPPPLPVHQGVRSLGPRRTRPIRYRSLSLPRLRERAEPVAVDGEELTPFVFYTRAALARAERIARRGAAFDPPVETGGILIGSLCCCPETGRVFTVVSDVLEATDADATTYSLLYTGPTWARIRSVLRARAEDPDPVVGSSRAVGQVHGHSFHVSEKCQACDDRETCDRSSAFLSAEDLRWCRAVFSGQPWQVSQIFGLRPDGRPTSAFFGQKGGTLVRRGYHVVEEADVDRAPEEGE
jgi:hypothetical protein